MTSNIDLSHDKSVPRQQGYVILNKVGRDLVGSEYLLTFLLEYSLLTGGRVREQSGQKDGFCRTSFGSRAIVRFKDQPTLRMNHNSKAERYFTLYRDSILFHKKKDLLSYCHVIFS